MDFSSRLAEIPQQQQQQPPAAANPPHPSYALFFNAPQHPHHPQAYPPYAYYHPPNPNPNPNAHYDPAGVDTGLRPPGVDSYAPNPYAPHGGYVVGAVAAVQYGQPEVAAAAYIHDPNVQQQNWGGAGSAGYAAVSGLWFDWSCGLN